MAREYGNDRSASATTRLKPTEKEILQIVSKVRGISMSELMREAIESYCDRVLLPNYFMTIEQERAKLYVDRIKNFAELHNANFKKEEQ